MVGFVKKVKNKRYGLLIAELSDRLVQAQKPIRILDSVKWPKRVGEELLASKFKKIPSLRAEDYAARPLKFNLDRKTEELLELRRLIGKKLGSRDPVGKILLRNTEQYLTVVELIRHRGTLEFYKYSKELYGSTHTHFMDGRNNVYQLSQLLEEIFKNIEGRYLGDEQPKNLTSVAVVNELNRRLGQYFHSHKVRVLLDDGIISDAAAGADYVKIKRAAQFSQRDVDILEVHEGWTHVGTTLNGQSQPYAKWLAKGPPCVVAVQEGLAVMMEVFTFNSSPQRAARINNRVLACRMVEDGANVLDVAKYFHSLGLSDEETLMHTQRIFRGGPLTGGAPFTKDIVYCLGFVMLYNFFRTAVRMGRTELIPFIFCGKLKIEDVPVLYHLYEEGLLEAPRYLPRHFADLNGLTVWMAFSNFFNRIDLEKVQKKYQAILQR